jgi:hypothetical protein
LKLLEQAKKELYPGCKNATKVSFIVELFQIKCMYGLSNAALEAILKLFGKVLPERHCIPNSLDKVQRVVRDLGLDYVKIHTCQNDCVLFFDKYANLETCPICKKSRWKVVEKPLIIIAVQLVLLLLRSGYRLRSYATFLLFLGCKECICQSKCQRICSGTRKNW